MASDPIPSGLLEPLGSIDLSLDYANNIHLTIDHTLSFNRSTSILTIVSDTIFSILDPVQKPLKSSTANPWSQASKRLREHSIPTTFNIFMNANVLPSGELDLKPARTLAGDYIEFRTKMNLIVGLAARSAEMSNGGTFKPIDTEIFAAPPLI